MGEYSTDTKPDEWCPEGLEFLDALRKLYAELQAETDDAIPKCGEKAPACLAWIGTNLSLLDRMASCIWGCRRGNHKVEYLLGRTASSGGAAVQLMRQGFYDESLSISRNLGEIANLLMFFALDTNSLRQWESGRKFKPSSVRSALRRLDGILPITDDRYKALTETATHATPDIRPQAHNILGFPSIGGISFQQAGVLLCLNEIAVPLAFAVLAATKLLGIEPDRGQYVRHAAAELLRSVGGVEITSMAALWNQVAKDHAHNGV